MRITNRYKWAAAIATTLITLIAFVFLLIKTYSHDDSKYFESRDFVRQLKQLDATWGVKILRAKVDMNSSLLLGAPAESSNRWDQLDKLNNSGPLLALWNDRRQGYLDAVQNKTQLVEQFRKHNMLLRTALDALPKAEDNIQELLKGIENIQPLKHLTNSSNILNLTLATLEYTFYASNEKATEI